jgi:hypothetical protein
MRTVTDSSSNSTEAITSKSLLSLAPVLITAGPLSAREFLAPSRQLGSIAGLASPERLSAQHIWSPASGSLWINRQLSDCRRVDTRVEIRAEMQAAHAAEIAALVARIDALGSGGSGSMSCRRCPQVCERAMSIICVEFVPNVRGDAPSQRRDGWRIVLGCGRCAEPSSTYLRNTATRPHSWRWPTFWAKGALNTLARRNTRRIAPATLHEEPAGLVSAGAPATQDWPPHRSRASAVQLVAPNYAKSRSEERDGGGSR